MGLVESRESDMSGKFSLARQKNSNRKKLIAKLEPKLEKLIFRAQIYLVELLECNDIDLMIELCDELQSVLFMDQPALKRNLFIYIQPEQALHLDINDKVFSQMFDIKHWRLFLDDLKTYKLLEHDFKDLSPTGFNFYKAEQ